MQGSATGTVHSADFTVPGTAPPLPVNLYLKMVDGRMHKESNLNLSSSHNNIHATSKLLRHYFAIWIGMPLLQLHFCCKARRTAKTAQRTKWGSKHQAYCSYHSTYSTTKRGYTSPSPLLWHPSIVVGWVDYWK